MQTPYFLISQQELDRNIDSFQEALKEIWPNSQLAYSVKTNSLPWLLRYLNEKGVFAEVVSDEEYQLAKMCGYRDDAIVYNGPIKGKKQLLNALNGNAIVNLDSKSDLKILAEYDGIINRNVGIRVNPDPSIFQLCDIGYEEDGFRFGFSDENDEFAHALYIVKSKTARIGLHLHCNSITRSKNVYIAIARYAAKLIKKYELSVSYIDIGGGFFGGVPGKTTPEEYIWAIRKELEGVVNINETKLIIEPGSAIIGSVVDLVTSVVDIKTTSKSRIVTTDGSRIHIDPLWIKNKYLYSTFGNEYASKHPRQIICGYTCMDHDRLMIIENENELAVGNHIVYHRVGAYSMTFGGMFIRYYPPVYVNNGKEEFLVRDRITTDQYIHIHAINKGEVAK